MIAASVGKAKEALATALRATHEALGEIDLTRPVAREMATELLAALTGMMTAYGKLDGLGGGKRG